MDTKFGLDTPKLQFVVESRRLFSVKFVLVVLAFIVFIYAFFWHALLNDVLAGCCVFTTITSLFLYWRVTRGLDSITAANGALILSTSIVYLTGIYTWNDSPAGVAFFPAIIAGAMIFWGRRKAILWTGLCTVLVISLPWATQLANPMPSFSEVRTFFNVFYSATALIVVCAIVYLADDISLSLVNELVSMKNRLERTQDDLIKVQRYRNRFFASISHEIRTPMNAVRGISEILTQSRNPLGGGRAFGAFIAPFILAFTVNYQ